MNADPAPVHEFKLDLKDYMHLKTHVLPPTALPPNTFFELGNIDEARSSYVENAARWASSLRFTPPTKCRGTKRTREYHDNDNAQSIKE